MSADREGGFTVVELTLAMLLFAIVGYVSMSLITMTFDTTAKMLAEFDSRKRVLLLQREMAEGTLHYAGYLAASGVAFEPGVGEFEDSCIFRITFPDYEEDTDERTVEYIWRSSTEEIFQRVDDGDLKRLLTNVAKFSVTKVPGDAYSLRVEIAHRVKGFANPIVRTTDGQARNMDLRSNVLAESIKECPAP